MQSQEHKRSDLGYWKTHTLLVFLEIQLLDLLDPALQDAKDRVVIRVFFA